MSDQTDIEQSIRELITTTSMKAVVANRTDLREVLEVFAQELNALRDEETARLKGPLPATLQSWSYAREMSRDSKAVPYDVAERLEAEVHQLRARLAEERTLSDLLASSMTGEIPMLVAIIEYSKTLADPNEARTVITKFEQRNARVLALEFQCQRMRDALTRLKESHDRYDWSDHGRDIIDPALSAPLDLELLNMVRESLTLFLKDWVPNTCEFNCCKPYNDAHELLKSLSPS